MQTSHHAIATNTFVILAKMNAMSQYWTDFFFKFSFVKALESITTSVTKEVRFYNEHTINIGFDYIHCCYIKKVGSITRTKSNSNVKLKAFRLPYVFRATSDAIYSAYPFGLFFCQFQLSRHISSIPYLASHPNSALALAGLQ